MVRPIIRTGILEETHVSQKNYIMNQQTQNMTATLKKAKQTAKDALPVLS